MLVNTEFTQSNFETTQSLHRAIQIYTEEFWINTESTQSNADLNRVYTEQIWHYTESTQGNFGTTQSLQELILGLNIGSEQILN